MFLDKSFKLLGQSKEGKFLDLEIYFIKGHTQ